MSRIAGRLPSTVVALTIALATSGCSWLMVAGPPPPTGRGLPPGVTMVSREPLGCTHSRAAPHVDMTVAVTYGGFGALMAILGGALLTSSDDYNRMMGGMYLGAGAVAVGFATPFYLSARSGYRKVTACRAADR